MNVRVIGRGKLGRALHAALRGAGKPSQLSAGRSQTFRASAGRTMYVIAVPDAQINLVSQRLARVVRQHDIVVHASGNRGPSELQACRLKGAHVATMHPMVSFASARNRPELSGSIWLARGDDRAVRAARALARAIGARCVAGPAGNPAYHAAAATVANGSAALAALTVRILQALDLDQKTAEHAVASLLRSVASNVERVGLPAALTGPIRRGDADTIRAHVHALQALDPALARHYIALAPLILECAISAGLSKRDAARIRRALTLTSRGTRALNRPE